MKARVIVIEADDVSPSEVGQVLARVFGAPLADRSDGDAKQLPLPEPAAASAPTARPRTRRAASDANGSGHRQSPAVGKVMCGACGADQPEGKDGRSRCPKCNARAWETVSANNGDDAEA